MAGNRYPVTVADLLAAKGLGTCAKCRRIMLTRHLEQGVCDDCRRQTRQLEMLDEADRDGEAEQRSVALPGS